MALDATYASGSQLGIKIAIAHKEDDYPCIKQAITDRLKWSINVCHKGTGNDCHKGRHFAMTNSTPAHQRSMGRHTCGAGRQQLLLSSSSSLLAL